MTLQSLIKKHLTQLKRIVEICKLYQNKLIKQQITILMIAYQFSKNFTENDSFDKDICFLAYYKIS